MAAYDPVTDFDRVKNKGALPTDEIVKVLIRCNAAGPILAARETTTPDQQLFLPSPPSSAADMPPPKPVTSLMDETRGPQP